MKPDDITALVTALTALITAIGAIIHSVRSASAMKTTMDDAHARLSKRMDVASDDAIFAVNRATTALRVATTENVKPEEPKAET